MSLRNGRKKGNSGTLYHLFPSVNLKLGASTLWATVNLHCVDHDESINKKTKNRSNFAHTCPSTAVEFMLTAVSNKSITDVISHALFSRPSGTFAAIRTNEQLMVELFTKSVDDFEVPLF